MYEEDIEGLFFADIRKKKTTASGLRGRASRLRKHETVIMSTQRMNKLHRTIITAPGILNITTVGVIKMQELLERIKQGEIISKDEIDALPFEDAQKIIAELRRIHSVNKLFKVWKTNWVQAKAFMEEKYQVYKQGKQVVIGKNSLEEKKVHNVVLEKENKVKEKAMIMSMKKVLSGEELGNLFTRLQMFLGESEQKYEIEILIKEIE